MNASVTLDPVTLGQTIRAVRKQAKLSQQQVADRIGVGRSTLVAMEAGSRRVTAQELAQLAGIYQIPVESFLATSQASQIDARLSRLSEAQKRVIVRLIEQRPDALAISLSSREQAHEAIACVLLHVLFAQEAAEMHSLNARNDQESRHE